MKRSDALVIFAVLVVCAVSLAITNVHNTYYLASTVSSTEAAGTTRTESTRETCAVASDGTKVCTLTREPVLSDRCINLFDETGNRVGRHCQGDGTPFGTCMSEAAGDEDAMERCVKTHSVRVDGGPLKDTETDKSFVDSTRDVPEHVKVCLRTADNEETKNQCFRSEAERRLANLEEKKRVRLLAEKERVIEKIDTVETRIQALRDARSDLRQVLADLEGVLADVEDYDFTESTGEEIRTAVDEAVDASGEVSTVEVRRLRAKLDELKLKARKEKARDGVIPFEDTDTDNEFLQHIQYLKERNIVSGFNGKFDPKRSINRSEIAKVALRAANVDVDETFRGTEQFDDVSTSNTLRGYIEKAKELGIVSGVDGKFLPNRPVTRLEALQMLLRAQGVEPTEVSSSTFSDLRGYSAREIGFVEYARRKGIIASGSTFRPNDPISREEMAKVVENAVTLADS